MNKKELLEHINSDCWYLKEMTEHEIMFQGEYPYKGKEGILNIYVPRLSGHEDRIKVVIQFDYFTESTDYFDKDEDIVKVLIELYNRLYNISDYFVVKDN